MPSIIHFEIPADDVERAEKFYSGLFGWRFEKAPDSDYWMVSTGVENAIGGGLMKRENPRQTITNYIDVPSVEKYMKKAEKLGGRVVVPKKAVPGMGYFAICLDGENNPFGLWESDEEAK